MSEVLIDFRQHRRVAVAHQDGYGEWVATFHRSRCEGLTEMARQAIDVRASVTGGDGAMPETVDFFLDGKVVARSPWPYATRIKPTPGAHELVALPSNPKKAARVRPTRFTVW